MLAVQSRKSKLVMTMLNQEPSPNPFYTDCLGWSALDYAKLIKDKERDEIVKAIN